MGEIILKEYFDLLEGISVQEQRVKLLDLQQELNKQGRFEEEQIVIERIKELD